MCGYADIFWRFYYNTIVIWSFLSSFDFFFYMFGYAAISVFLWRKLLICKSVMFIKGIGGTVSLKKMALYLELKRIRCFIENFHFDRSYELFLLDHGGALTRFCCKSVCAFGLTVNDRMKED
jgi:hypothetical protein